MLAAAEYGEDGEKAPPPELELAFSCHRWNTLPEAGGLLDQPAGMMRRMSIVENIYNAFHGLRQAKDYAKFGDDNPQAMRVIENIYKLRKEHGG